VAWAEFEEKEFEIAAAIELALTGSVFSSGQVLEGIVGYDAAVALGPGSPLWRILGARRPRGVRLVPTMWAPGPLPRAWRLPQSPVSLILQYKRPELLSRSTAKQWHLWNGRYYRFTCDTDQRDLLCRLEQAVGGRALVRYAAPAFFTRGELEQAHLARVVLRRSGFLSPLQLGNHNVWTYQRPGRRGRPNPDGEEVDFESFRDLSRRLRLPYPSMETPWYGWAESDEWPRWGREFGGAVREHVGGLADSLRRAELVSSNVYKWRSLLERELAGHRWAGDVDIELVVDCATVLTTVSAMNADWYLVA
jgi:hypothetical protein